ncbi:esterase [Mycolicibacterium sp. CBM1]
MTKHAVRTALMAGVVGAVTWTLAGTAVAVAAPLNDPSGLCTTHDAKGNCWLAASGPSSNIDIVIPAKVPQEQAVVDYVTGVLNDYNAMVQHGTLDNPVPAQELDVTTTSYTSGSAATGTQTVVLKVYQNMGGPHPNTSYKAFALSDATKAPITFNTLFRPGSQPLTNILPIVEQQMSATAGQPITIAQDIGLDPANYQNFAITDDAVIFFFDQDQIHPAFEATQVSVPRSVIAGSLSPGI